VRLSSTTRPAITAVFLAVLLAAFLTLAPGLSAQSSRDGAGLTGDPLVDSILQAPGPDFIERGRRPREERRYWDRADPPRERARESRDERPGPERPREGWEDEPEVTEEWDRREPALRESAPARRVMQDPPPPPVQRGDGPLDIIILDSDTGSETLDPPDSTAQVMPRETYAEQAPEELAALRDGADTATQADEMPERTASAEEPYREPGETADQVAPAPEAPAPERVASAPPPAAERAPATPVRAPERPRIDPEIDRMIGQMLLLGFPGQKTSDAGVRQIAQQLETGQVGGVILMSRNIESPAQVKRLTRYLTDAASARPTPFVAVDQEGGYVQRLSRTKGFKTHPSAERLGARNDPQGAYSAYRNLALELRDYGFNLNLGPVVDLNLNPANPVIGRLKRSYGKNADHVSAFAKAFVFAHNETGLLTAAKHFPGHGSSETDSHDVLVDVSSSWTEAELRPYRNLIEAQAIDMIMVGHLYHPSFSESPDTPVSLSAKGIESVLRGSLNYDGVVITDDLDMRGVRQNTNFEERVVGAVAAGNDILLITNANGYQPDLPERVAEVIRSAINNGRLSVERIRKSYERIMALKDKLSRLQRTATSAGEDRGLADHASGG